MFDPSRNAFEVFFDFIPDIQKYISRSTVCGCMACQTIFDVQCLKGQSSEKCSCPFCFLPYVVPEHPSYILDHDSLKEAHFFGFRVGFIFSNHKEQNKMWIDRRWVSENQEWCLRNKAVREFLQRFNRNGIQNF